MRVRLMIESGDNLSVYVKSYPLAKDEEEARSMMYRDHIGLVMWALDKGEAVTFDIQPIT